MEESDNKDVAPYRFNAKELDEETGLYYYGARYLDPTSVGWLSVDPLFEKYVGMSPYNYCAGNPVRLVDVDGREFTEEAEMRVKSLEQEITRRVDAIDNSGKKRKWHENERQSLIKVKEEIDILRSSDQVYDVQTYEEESYATNRDLRGKVVYNQKTNHFIIMINKWSDFATEGSEMGAFAHELLHAYQFETGKISFKRDFRNNITEFAGKLYDITDEEEAHARGALFGAGNASVDIKMYPNVKTKEMHMDRRLQKQIDFFNRNNPNKPIYQNEIYRVP